MKYPEGLVHEYGAKAGILMYVAEKLPDISQAPMVASRTGETTAAFLRRIRKPKFNLPWLVRSSAVEELDGYEGEFPTLESWPDNLRAKVDEVRSSPTRLKQSGIGMELPDQINAIVAEKARSEQIGTYIKHPNQDEKYLFALTPTDRHYFWGATRFSYASTPDGKVEPLEWFNNWLHKDSIPPVEDELAKIAKWHDRIASLPDMDPNWAYQIEFGLNPTLLFQVRPFKQIEKPAFKVADGSEIDFDIIRPIIIGVTPPEGIEVRAKALEYNFAFEMYDNLPEDGEPLAAFGRLRAASNGKRYDNLQATLLSSSEGFLQHDDVAVMRRSQVTALYPPGGGIPGRIEQGDWLKIKADGTNIKIENKK